jgi:hypothetical protein
MPRIDELQLYEQLIFYSPHHHPPIYLFTDNHMPFFLIRMALKERNLHAVRVLEADVMVAPRRQDRRMN